MDKQEDHEARDALAAPPHAVGTPHERNQGVCAADDDPHDVRKAARGSDWYEGLFVEDTEEHEEQTEDTERPTEEVPERAR